MDEAAVLAECAAHPDDDGPRLVWADLVGGARGELVVIQCDLARGDLPPAEVAARRRRERALLERYAVEWAGALAHCATQWSFRRGFIESARIVEYDRVALAAHPLLATLVIEDESVLPHLRDLRGLGIPRLVDTPLLESLQALRIELFEPEDLDQTCALLARTRITRLELSASAVVEEEDLVRLVEAAPHVETLRVWGHTRLRLQRPVRGLGAGLLDFATLAATSQDTIERLRITLADVSAAQLLELGKLQTLSIAGSESEVNDAVRILGRSAALPALRAVRIESSVDPASLRAFIERYGEQLECLELACGTTLPDTAIAGELRSTPWYQELLHHEHRTFHALGVPHVPDSHRAAFARVDGTPAVWDLTNEPIDRHIFVGRATDNTVQINDSTISRLQCSLGWRDGVHDAVDQRSTHGICVDGVRVHHTELADGAELMVGRVILRYFVGLGAFDRAVAAVERAHTHDYVTDLPFDPNPPHTVDITNWAKLRHREGYSLDPQVLRALVAELRRFAGSEPITVVKTAIFGVQAATAARIGTRRIVVTVGEHHIGLEVVAQ